MAARIYGRLRSHPAGGFHFQPAERFERGAGLLSAVLLQAGEAQVVDHREGFDVVRVTAAALHRIRHHARERPMNQPSLFDDAAPVAAPKKPRTSRTRVQRIVELREQAGELYQQADELLAEVIAAEKVGASFKLNDGRTFAVVDHFQDKEGNPRNKAWKPAGVTRFDVEELKPSRSRRK